MPYSLNLDIIHSPHKSCAFEFIVRGPKLHCLAAKAYAESAWKVGPTSATVSGSLPVADLDAFLHDAHEHIIAATANAKNTENTVLFILILNS